MFAEGLWDKIFVTETVTALGRALNDEDVEVRASMVTLYTAAMAQGAPSLFSPDIHTKIFAGGLWDKIFVTGTVAAFGHALDGRDSYVRTSMVKFFTAAIAQGALQFFRRIFSLKYLQRVFGTRYLSLRPSPHLDMHYYMIEISTSEPAWSSSSLLP